MRVNGPVRGDSSAMEIDCVPSWRPFAAVLLAGLLAWAPAIAKEGDDIAQNPAVVLEKQGVEYAYPHFSNDDKRILFQSKERGVWRLCIYELESRAMHCVTADTLDSYFADWSPDNSRICFTSDRTGSEEIYVMKSDGTGQTQITDNGARNIHPYWSPDGTRIIFSTTMESLGNLDLFEMNPDGSGLTRITDTEDHETCARISPKSDKVIFLRNNEFDLDDIFILAVGDSSVTNISGTPSVRDGWPTWAPDGSAAVYAAMDHGSFKLVRYNLADGTTVLLTEPPEGSDDCRANYSADGRKIVFNRQTDSVRGRTNAIWILTLSGW